MSTRRYNRIEWLQFGKDRRTFDLMIDAAADDADWARDNFRVAQHLRDTMVATVRSFIDGQSEREREIINEDRIGPRIY